MGIRQTFLIVALATASFAQDISAKADQFVSAFVKQNRFSGVVLVANQGKPVFEKAYGMANYEWGVPNTMDTRFRLGSVTKQFTAVGILKLEELGRLKVTDKACDYLPACPEPWKPITIHQLLTHTSGIPNFTGAPGYTKVKAFPSRYDAQVKLVWEMKMDFDPGTRFQYSNTGYIILGKIIDKAGGMPWEDFLRKEIFLPAGMNNTMHDSHSDLILKRAAGYRSNGGPPVNASYIDMRIPGAAGALVSTAGDLLKWDRALASGKLLTEASMNKMWTVDKSDYAYGWIVQKQDGKTVQGHSGGVDGFSTQLSRIVEDGLLIVVLSNFEDGQTSEIRRGLTQLAMGKDAELPKPRTEVQLETPLLDEYVGSYEISPTFILSVTREGTQLITQASGQGKLPIYAEAKDLFFPKLIPATIQFVRKDGKVAGLILKQGGREMKANKTQ